MNNYSRNKTSIFSVILKIIIPLCIYVLVSIFFVYISRVREERESYLTSSYAGDIPVIIIDAGHGGRDGGALSSSGIVEKDINLNIAKFLSDYLSMSGIECILTRSEDIELTPKEHKTSSKKRADLLARIEIANSYDNALFLSIHQNKFPSSKLRGLQVFYSKNNPLSKDAADIIKKKNNLYIDSSNKREVKPAGKEILVLDSITVPAVLVECGFLSNETEAQKLNSPEYQQKLAFMLYSSVIEYLDVFRNKDL